MYAFLSQLDTISTIEAMLMGDPFELLTHKTLAGKIGKIDKIWFSVLSMIQIVFSCISGIFHKIPFPNVTTKNMKYSTKKSLLFRKHLVKENNYSVVLYPNQQKLVMSDDITIAVNSCICTAAKNVILKVRKQNEEQQSLNWKLRQKERKQLQFEERLTQIENAIAMLSRQITSLTKNQ